MIVPTKIESAPAAFAGQAAKINEIIDALTPILNATGGGSIKITKSGVNWIISSSSESSLVTRLAAVESSLSSALDRIGTLETQVATLNTLLDGLSRTTVDYCTGEPPATVSKTILMS
jgi:hypothetical protein